MHPHPPRTHLHDTFRMFVLTRQLNIPREGGGGGLRNRIMMCWRLHSLKPGLVLLPKPPPPHTYVTPIIREEKKKSGRERTHPPPNIIRYGTHVGFTNADHFQFLQNGGRFLHCLICSCLRYAALGPILQDRQRTFRFFFPPSPPPLLVFFFFFPCPAVLRMHHRTLW